MSKKYKRKLKRPEQAPIALTKRTRLSPDQLNRVRGSAGEGLASRYDNDGVQSLRLTRNLLKARRKARRFVLYTDEIGRRMYVADPARCPLTKSDRSPLTFDKSQALQFFEGFDDPEAKTHYFEKSTMFTPEYSYGSPFPRPVVWSFKTLMV